MKHNEMKYSAPKLNITFFETTDVIVASDNPTVYSVEENVKTGGGITLDGKSGSDYTNSLALVL